MDLDPASWGGLELGLKIGPVKTSSTKVRTPSAPVRSGAVQAEAEAEAAAAAAGRGEGAM